MTYGPQSEPPQQPGSFSGPPPAWQPQAKGFFGALFDFSFNHFVTRSVIKVLYILGFIGIILGYLWLLVVMFSLSSIAGFLALIFGLVFAIFELVFWRVTLEFYIAVVRMSDDIHRMSDGIHRGGFPGSR
jgi:hypothetical protein